MMFFWITIIILVVLFILSLFFTYRFYKLNKTLTEELVNTKVKPIIIWKLTKYSDEELKLLLTNPEVIDLLMKIFEYQIAKHTDSIRTLEWTEEKVGYVNCLHVQHLFFYKLKQQLQDKKKKAWQNLV